MFNEWDTKDTSRKIRTAVKARAEHEECYSRTAEQKTVIRYRDIGVLEVFMEKARRIAV